MCTLSKRSFQLRAVTIFSFLLFILIHGNAQLVKEQEILKNHLKNDLLLSEDVVNSVKVSRAYTDPSSGIEHMYAYQTLNGISVTGSYFAMHSSGLKRVDVNQLYKLKEWQAKSITIGVSSKEAVEIILDEINYPESRNFKIKSGPEGTDKKTVYQRNESSIYDIPVRLAYYSQVREKQLIPSWEIQIMDVYKKHYWLYYVDASTGKILSKKDLIVHCDFGQPNTVSDISRHYFPAKNGFTDHAPHIRLEENNKESFLEEDEFLSSSEIAAPKNKYRVFDIPFEHPNDAAAAHNLITNAGDPLGSPDGWHQVFGLGPLVTYIYTHGNNVWAFYDPTPSPLGGVPSADPDRTAYNNTLIGGLPKLTEPFKFDYPFNANKEPEVYRKAAIVNLFYWNNLMHDVYYNFGFTESAGNFQESNIFSSGLRGSATEHLALDEVLAQAQDGGGTNNANFLTLPDGINGQMQMYLWTASVPDSLLHVAGSSNADSIAPGTKFYGIQGSFSSLPTANNNLYDSPVVNRPLVIIQTNEASTIGDETQGCTTGQQGIALPPANNVTNKIVLIDRGECSFVEKVFGAQLGGAVGVVIINNVEGPPLAMGGSDATTSLITIPAIMISLEDGEELKSLIRNGVEIKASLKRNTKPPPGRDGDFDNGVIAHEYGHGISNRLTGGGDALLPLGGDEQGGEGWSDFCALYMTIRNNDLAPANAEHPFGILPSRGIGNYVTYQPNDGPGIRPAPYSIYFEINPLTFGNIDDGGEITVPHGVGSIWCEMLYELMQAFIDKYGINDNIYEGANPVTVGGVKQPNVNAKGNNIVMRLIVEGMKMQPLSPDFEEQRDAILSADSLLYDGMHSCLIWEAFAKRGLGFSAKSNSFYVGDEFEAFDVPLTCNPNQKRIMITKTGPAQIVNKDTVQYNLVVTNLYNSRVDMIVYDTLAPQFKFVSASPGFSRRGRIVYWRTSLNGNQSRTYTVRVKADAKSASNPLLIDTHEDGTSGWNTGTILIPNGKWTLKTDTGAYSGNKYWFAPEVGFGGSNTVLTSTITLPVNLSTKLVFTHKYLTEITYDGGIVEVSEDGGANWVFLPAAKFESNGYNAAITVEKNPNIGSYKAAFTGNSGGYITSVASLEDYAGKNILFRFRMTCDAGGGSEPGGGWWIDDVEVLNNKTDIINTALAGTNRVDRYVDNIGSNVYSSTSAILLADTSTAPPKSLVAKTSSLPNRFTAVVFPNPAKDVVNIDIQGNNGKEVYLKLFDNMGKALSSFNAGNGKSILFPLNVSGLANGTYWIEVRTEEQSTTLPLVVKH